MAGTARGDLRTHPHCGVTGADGSSAQARRERAGGIFAIWELEFPRAVPGAVPGAVPRAVPGAVPGAGPGPSTHVPKSVFWRLQKSKFVNNSSATQRQPRATSEPPYIEGSPVPMVPLPGLGARALETYLRIIVFLNKRVKDIELERERERDT